MLLYHSTLIFPMRNAEPEHISEPRKADPSEYWQPEQEPTIDDQLQALMANDYVDSAMETFPRYARARSMNRTPRQKVVRKYSSLTSGPIAAGGRASTASMTGSFGDLQSMEPLRAGEIVRILQRIAQRKGLSIANKTLRYGISR